MALVGLTFSPLPVARAALMDAHERVPMVKIMAFTFFAQWLPWAFYDYITKAPYTLVMLIVLIALLANSFLMIFFKEDIETLKKQMEKKENLPGLSTLGSWKLILFTFIALGLAETTFFLISDKLENDINIRQLWWPSIGAMTFLGNLAIVLFYRRKPSVSILSFSYFLGFCVCASALLSISLGISTSSAISIAIIRH